MRQIYLAGGCFWGLEQYLAGIPGVVKTEVGYANGRTEHPSYEDVCHKGTGHAETVRVEYDPARLSLPFLLSLFYEAIDPTSINRQGADIGAQYRTGIYDTDAADREVILHSLSELQRRLSRPVAIEAAPLANYYPAEDYHQQYLDKHPGGYCHIAQDLFSKARKAIDAGLIFPPKPPEELHGSLTELQFKVTQNGFTEPPFHNEYYDHFEPGIYVDITTGEPLFTSGNKFDAGCGWPSFAKPLAAELIEERVDTSHGLCRTEVRSRHGKAHLGHVFPDGPQELGGLRYCINSASLRFIPRDRMQVEGYGAWLPSVATD